MTISNEEFSEILKRLEDNDPTLTTLDFLQLQHIYIGHEEALALAEVLEKNSTLKTLDLAGRRISDAEAIAIAKALITNRSLTELNLQENKITDEGAIAIAQALEKNTSLKELKLSINNIADPGATAVAQALETNTSLTRLFLSRNHIADKGSMAFIKTLEANTSLTTLDLTKNHIHIYDTTDNEGKIEEQKACEKILKNNFYIQTLMGFSLPNNIACFVDENRFLKLSSFRELAKNTLNISFKPVSISAKEIQKIRETYKTEKKKSLKDEEAHKILKQNFRIKKLKRAIEFIELTQKKFEKIFLSDWETRDAYKEILIDAGFSYYEKPRNSQRYRKMLDELNLLKENCVFRRVQLRIKNFQNNIEEKDAKDVQKSFIEEWSSIPENSIFFTHAHLEAFSAAYNQYCSENVSPLQAFVQALPLLQKENGSLHIDFSELDKDIKEKFKLGERNPSDAFDFILQEVATKKVFDEPGKKLKPEERLALLQLGLLHHLKNLTIKEELKKTEKTKQTKSPFFKGEKDEVKEKLPSLEKILNNLPKEFDETNETQRESIKKSFNETCDVLKELPGDKYEKNESNEDLEICRDLMEVLENTTLPKDISEKRVSASTGLGKN